MSFDFGKDPLTHFQLQLERARVTGVTEPTAMQLATIDPTGNPSLRTVLFKGIEDQGFSFYTNLDSPKGKDLKLHPCCSLLFFWATLSEQIRIQGEVKTLTPAQNQRYFSTRPRLSQIGAWASAQSAEIESFEFFENRVLEVEKKFQGQEIPCPPHWGGFSCVPLMIEFWFGKAGRLHQRYVYERSSIGSPWRRYLKSP